MPRSPLSLSSLVLVPLALVGACMAASSPSTSRRASEPGSTAPRGYFWVERPAGKTHSLMPSPRTIVWGGYDPFATPALRIASGDQVDVGTVSTCGARLLQPGKDTGTVEQAYRAIAGPTRDTTIKRGPGGHILTGPIYVEGAEPGDVLEVRIKSVDLDIPYACNSFSTRSGFLPEDFEPGTSRTRIVPLDRTRMIGAFDSSGIEIPLAPFFGSMGVAPSPSAGRISSAPPGTHAGNLDNKELVAGTVLYIPIRTAGALFVIGDGHAAQGDGEVDITALETALRGRLQFITRKDMKLTWPRGETRTHYIAMATDSNLTKATKLAVREALVLLGDVKGMAREDAYMLVSTACDVRVTQLVDGTMGVHVMIPKRLFTK